MTLDVNKDELTILGVPFDNFSNFDTVWYALGSSIKNNVGKSEVNFAKNSSKMHSQVP